MKKKYKIFISIGELSGDIHGIKLINELLKLSKNFEITGLSGDNLKGNNVDVLFNMSDLSVVGLFEILKKISFFKQVFDKTVKYIEETKPDAVILIDYPGFNIRLAKYLKKKYKNKIKVIYFILPQIWAWWQSRAHKILNNTDLLLTIFKFEEKFYRKFENTNKIVFTGHPLLQKIKKEYYFENKKYDFNFVTLLPGSRENEIKKILPEMLETAKLILKKYPNYKIILSSATKYLKNKIQELIPANLSSKLNIVVGDSYSLIQNSKCVITSSGTATLEIGIIGTPMVILYKVNYLTGLVANMVLKYPYIGLINIALEKYIAKEFIQKKMQSKLIFEEIEKILSNTEYSIMMHKELIEVRNKLGSKTAYTAAAKNIFDFLNKEGN